MLLVFLCLLVQAFALKSYEGYHVIRLPFNNTEQYDAILGIAEMTLADVWSANPAQGWLDVMVRQSDPLWSMFVHEVKIPDVEAHLQAHQHTTATSAPDFNFDFFPTTGQVRTWVADQIRQNSNIASLVKIGTTYSGEEIHGVSIGDPSSPIYYMHCAIHAREWITTTSCLWIIDQLLNKDNDRAKLTEMYHWIIVPILNIDGYDYTFTGDRLWRKNRQPNSGSSCIGTDCNRNYGFGWGGGGASTSPCSETYRGAKAFSSPESKSEMDFLDPYLSVGQVKVYLDIHSYGGWFLSAWGYTTTGQPQDYPAMLTQMISATTAMKAVNGNTYTYGQSGRTLYITSGSTVDHLYGEGGVIQSYTIECAGDNFVLPVSKITPVGREVWAGVKKIALDQRKL